MEFSHQQQQVQGNYCSHYNEHCFAAVFTSIESTQPSVLNYICMGSRSSSNFGESSTIDFIKVT